MNHCPNLNTPAIEPGKVNSDDLAKRIAEWDQHYTKACTANACKSGRKPCPCPDACRVPVEELSDAAASLWFWLVLGIALVGAGFLLAGGVNLLLNWARGVLA